MRDAPAPIPPPDATLVARFGRALDRQLRDLPDVTPDDRIGIAVSGGPDSLALLLLAHAARPGRVEAATVDHGLRADSAGEAAMVASVCARLGVPHVTASGVWDRRTGTGLQAAARDYRYRELTRWCGERRLAVLLTGHHADDQAETLLMRLARGAGLGGLGSIRPTRGLTAAARSSLPGEPYRNGPWRVWLVRPLLRFTKSELADVVSRAGLIAVDDPSNASARFDRSRARHLLAGADWLSPARIAASASHLAEADVALRWAADRAYEERVETDAKNDREAWLLDPVGLPDEILRRVVGRLLSLVEDHALAGDDGPVFSGPDVARLITRLRAGQTATLGHILARPGPRWRFTVAPPRRT